MWMTNQFNMKIQVTRTGAVRTKHKHIQIGQEDKSEHAIQNNYCAMSKNQKLSARLTLVVDTLLFQRLLTWPPPKQATTRIGGLE